MHDILVLYYDYIDSAVEHYEILQKYYQRHLGALNSCFLVLNQGPWHLAARLVRCLSSGQ